MRPTRRESQVAAWCIVGAIVALLFVYLGGFVAFRATHHPILVSPGNVGVYLLPTTAPNQVFARLYQPWLGMLGERIILL